MRVHVDRAACDLHAQCVFAAPEVFELTDDDYLEYDERPDPAHEDAVRQAVLACPVQAIRLTED
jgi:ferredoxin